MMLACLLLLLLLLFLLCLSFLDALLFIYVGIIMLYALNYMRYNLINICFNELFLSNIPFFVFNFNFSFFCFIHLCCCYMLIHINYYINISTKVIDDGLSHSCLIFFLSTFDSFVHGKRFFLSVFFFVSLSICCWIVLIIC